MKTFKILRHKSDQGFTLIELLVVILIIAILAAVGIVALLSALNSGKKSSATTVLRNGISAVRAWQSSEGQTNWTGLTLAKMQAAEPDITWVNYPTGATAGENSISFWSDTNQLWLTSRSEKGVCYYARLIIYGTTPLTYASEVRDTCVPVSTEVTSGWHKSTKQGWSK